MFPFLKCVRRRRDAAHMCCTNPLAEMSLPYRSSPSAYPKTPLEVVSNRKICGAMSWTCQKSNEYVKWECETLLNSALTLKRDAALP